jgi:sporulation protein YlmC with PRC-barrel domain
MRTFSSLTGREVATESGRRLGRCRDLRAEVRGSRLVVVGLVVGVRGLFERLGLGAPPVRTPDLVAWKAVVRIEGDRILVRDEAELE